MNKCNISKGFKAFLIVCLVLVLAPVTIYFSYQFLRKYAPPTLKYFTNTHAKFEGRYDSGFNKTLLENIDKYTEAEELGDGRKYTCVNKYYGRDSKYVYAYVMCNTFGQGRDAGGYGVPVRFEYDKDTLEIKSHMWPKDGSLHDPSLREMFPYSVYIRYVKTSYDGEGINELDRQCKEKYVSKRGVLE